ncbi:hypothetical protein [Desulfobacula toluolica]|nr:hypothetical protein [Desulfobacula toluolica]
MKTFIENNTTTKQTLEAIAKEGIAKKRGKSITLALLANKTIVVLAVFD